MFNRKVLKQRAKNALRTTYWSSFGILLLFSLISGLCSGVYSLRISGISLNIDSPAQMGALGVALIGSMVLSLAVSVFLISPISVGVDKFMLDAAKSNFTDIGSLGYCFRSNYKNIVITLLMMELILLAFTIPACVLAVLALIVSFGGAASNNLSGGDIAIILVTVLAAYALLIPMLMKFYDYYLVSYILADDPNTPWRDALCKSKQMMRGNRWATFVLNLSFIGWELLGAMACGIGILFVTPYVEATNAQLYLELSGQSRIEVFYDNDENI